MNGKLFTADDAKTLRIMNSIGCDDAMIASHTGHCRETIQRQRTAMGIPPCYAHRTGDWRKIIETWYPELTTKVATH